MSETETTEMINLLDNFEQEISNTFNLRIKELEERIEDLKDYNKFLEEINDKLENQNKNFTKRNKELEDKNHIFESTTRCYKQLEIVVTNLVNENEELRKTLKNTLKNNKNKTINKITIEVAEDDEE